MATPTDETTIDIDAHDAAAAKKAAESGKTAAAVTDPEPTVVVDPELSAKTGDKQVLTPEVGVDKLKKQLEEEKAARIAAESRAREAANGEATARGETQKTQLDLIKGAIEQTTQQLDVLETQYADAMTAQDFKAAGKVQREMSTRAAKLAQLEAGKTHLENAPKPAPRAPVDPVEAFVAQLSAPSAAWVRAHPEFVTDPQKNRQMIAAHELAIARGNKADTDSYFKSIEKTLDMGPVAQLPAHVDDPESDPRADAAQAIGGRQAPAAAPVSRSGNGAGGRPNVVKLSAEEVEMAKNMFPESKDPTLEYARNKAALRKEGKLS